jgi:hypothetical protein
MVHELRQRSLISSSRRGLALLICLGAAALGGTEPNAGLAALPDNTWRKLETTGMAKARMYSGACFDGGATEVWAYRYKAESE